MKNVSIKKFIPGIAWFFITTLLCCMPTKDLPKVENWLDKIYFDKWLHFGFFGIMAFLFMYPLAKFSPSLPKKKYYLLGIMVLVGLWGMAIEFIQKSVGRDFDLLDWVADSAGAVSAFLIVNSRVFKKINWF